MPQQFFISSAAATPAPMCINVSGGVTSGNPQLILYQQVPQTEPASALSNEAWEILPGGAIATALDPSMVLTAQGLDPNGSPLLLSPRRPGDAKQEWVILSAGIAGTPEQCVLVCKASLGSDNGTPFAINISWATYKDGQPMIVYPVDLSQPAPNALFELLPIWGVIGQWTAFKMTAAPKGAASKGTELALQMPMIAGGWEPDSSVAQVGACSAFGHNSTWQLTSDNTLQLAWNPELLLTAGVDGSNNPTGAVYVFPISTSRTALPNQQWVVPEPGVICLLDSNPLMALTAGTSGKTPAAGTAVTLTAYTPGAPTSNQVWDCFGSTLLATLLVQGQVPFPAPKSGTTQAAAYRYIESQLWPQETVKLGSHKFSFGVPAGGIRGQYNNLAAPLASYLAQIQTMTMPTAGQQPPLQQADWTEVVNQLTAEMTAVIAVQAFFAQMTAYAIELSLAQGEMLLNVAALCQVEASTPLKTKFNWRQCVMGVVYTLLNVAGFAEADPDLGNEIEKGLAKIGKYGAPVLANMMQTAFDSVQLKGEQAQPSTKLPNEFQNLQQALIQSFESMTAELGEIEALVLTDWSKLRAFYRMICMSEGAANLYWPSTAAPAMARKSLSGYTAQILQLLVPTLSNLQNYSASFNFGASSAGLSGDGATYTQHNTPFHVSSNNSPESGMSDSYNSYTSSLSTELLQYMWASGVVPFQFYHQIGGWSVPNNETRIDCGIIGELRNCTSETYLMFLDSTGVNGQGEHGSSGAWVPIPPYSVVNFDCVAEKGTNFTFPATVYEGSSPGGSVFCIAKINTDPTKYNSTLSQQPPSGYTVNISNDVVVAPNRVYLRIDYQDQANY